MKRILIVNCKYNLKYKYYIQDDGKVYSSITNKILSTQLDKDGYEKVQMVDSNGKRHRFSVHRLVLENFCPVPDMNKLQVNHKDGNKLNNNINNLEWVTCKENIQHAIKNNLRANQSGQFNNGAKLTEEEVKEIITMLLDKKYKYEDIGKKYGVTSDCIGAIKNKKNWKYLTENINF